MENFAHARSLMVETQLRPSNITDSQLLKSFGRIARECFVPEGRRAIAYSDDDHPLGHGGRMLPAVMNVARLLQLAEIGPNDIVLDVACGTGYSTAIIAGVASAVVGLEDDAALVEAANAALSGLDIGNAAVVKGNLTDGVPAEAPFDVIVIAGVVETIPPAFFAQLREGGRLVTMVAGSGTPQARLYVKSEGSISDRTLFTGSLPRLSAFAAEATFAL